MDCAMEELLPLVGKLTEMYTSHASTSVTYETAEQLMGAVLYCLREAEGSKEDGKGNGIVTMTCDMDLWTVYQAGYQKVLEKAARAKKVYERIISDFCAYGNRCYEDTVIKGMPEFFVRYDARFRPQDHLLTLDYPVLNPPGRRKGIDAIYFYLSCILLEQRFLSRFPRVYVTAVLEHFHTDYEDMVVNLCSVVMRNVMIHMMMGKKLSDHTVTEYEAAQFSRSVTESGRDRVMEMIGCFLARLVEENGGDNMLLAYLSCDKKAFAAELMNAAENGCVERILVY